MVIETGERADGRSSAEIRPLYIKAGYLPRVHGSGLFQRGQTQALSVCTLGMLNEWQRLDTIDPQRASAICTSTTSRRTAPARPVAWVPLSAARSATAAGRARAPAGSP